LLDVVDERLVSATSEYSFLALSYVWGAVEMLQTRKANVSLLMEKGALSMNKRRLPHVIRDAMHIVRALHQRYLWVDCLCIVQDGESQKHHQIQNMHSIYGASLLTLCAANGKCAETSCLAGIRAPCVFPTDVTHNRLTASIMGRSFLYFEPGIEQVELMYESRGWTFQEMLLSRRCLYLDDYSCTYSCRKPVDTLPQSEHISVSSRIRPLNISETEKQSRSDIYFQLVALYTERIISISYPTDRLNAFRGILSLWEKKYGQGSMLGLPMAIFDQALLWKVKPSVELTRNQSFPSWCWAGWTGGCYYD
ncbi:heterokaryon incompatibility protein-domain-containing protein, partial [Leptodontidium sp. MPI-SDFR-AT-0119]